MGKPAKGKVVQPTAEKPGLGSKARATRVKAIEKKLAGRRARGLLTSRQKRKIARSWKNWTEINAKRTEEAAKKAPKEVAA